MKRYKLSILACLSLVLLLASALSVGARSNGKQASQVPLSASAGKAASVASAKPVVINMANVPKETAKQAAANAQRKSLPFMTTTGFAQKKAAARTHAAAKQEGSSVFASAPKGTASPKTPGLITSFQGMSDSAATCPYFGGCAPPDQALAASFSVEMQGVNTSFAVYNTSGVLQPGWPKNAQNFFGVPNPGSCDPAGPFLSDPRLFYDGLNNRFWAAILQVEGSPIGDTCANSSSYWIAVSRTGNPSGAWNIYHFDMTLGSANWADYTEFGFDTQAIYFSGNMFSFSAGTYQYSEYLGAKKLTMMNGQAVTAFGFVDPTLGGVPLDTIQPVLTESLGVGGPLSGQFIASENIDFGGGGCSSGCSTIVVITVSNPGTSGDSASIATVSTGGYSLPPNADTPSCTACLDTNDTRIDSTPVWKDGLITFTLNTGVNNGTQVVPSLFWGQIAVNLNDNGSISSLSVYQQGYQVYGGDQAAFYGAPAITSEGDVYVCFGFSSSATNPEIAYVARRVTFAPGSLHDSGIVLNGGAGGSSGRWGDYSAASTLAPWSDQVWFSGEYAQANGDWATAIGTAKFAAGAS